MDVDRWWIGDYGDIAAGATADRGVSVSGSLGDSMRQSVGDRADYQ